MARSEPKVRAGFEQFIADSSRESEALLSALQKLGATSALDPKTAHLAYLAVLAALELKSGISFHALLARRSGASRSEVVSALLVGLPAAGNVVVQCLPAALAVFDER